MAKKYATDVLPEFLKRGFVHSRGVNQKPKPVEEKEKTPEENAKELAIALYKTNSLEEARRGLKLKLKEKETEQEKNPTPQGQREVDQCRKALEVFEATIKELTTESAKKEAALLNQIKAAEKKVEEAEKEVKKAIDDLIANIEKGEKVDILSSIQALEAAYEKHNSSLIEMKNYIAEYDKDNKETPYAPKYEEIKFTEEQTEKIYKGLRQQTTILLNSKKILGPLGNLKYTTKFQSFIASLPDYLGDKDKFKAIQERVDKELIEENKTPKEKAIEEINAKIKIRIEELFEQHTKEIAALSPLTIDKNYLTVSSEIGNIVDDYVENFKFKKSEVQKFISDAMATFKEKEKEKYGEYFVSAVREIIKIKEAIAKLSEMEYDGNEEKFKAEHSKVVDLIKSIKDSKLLKDAGIIIKYYENSQNISIDFNSEFCENINTTIVSAEIRNKMFNLSKPDVKTATENAKKKLDAKLAEMLREEPGKVSEADAKKVFTEELEAFKDLTPELKENIINEYLEEFKKAQKPQPKTIDEELETAKENTFAYFEKAIKDFKTSITRQDIYFELTKTIVTILDKDSKLTKDEKEAIIEKVISEIEEKLNTEYGKDFITGYNQVYELKKEIAALEKIDFKDEKFKTSYTALINKIKTVGASEAITKAGIKVELDEEEFTLKITFDNKKVDLVSMYIVPEDVRKEMKKKAEEKNPVTPPKPVENEEAEKEKDEAIKHYLEILKEIRDEINYLNVCNSTIEADANITFDNITSDKILKIVSGEKAAGKHEMNIINKKLELSNARANLRIKHNCYITKVQEVKDFEMPKVEFGQDYKMFVNHYDRMICIAEEKIRDLNKERMAEYTPENRANELTAQMKELVKYIEAVNSLIGRRIVAASIENDIDIVSFLQTRANEKDAIRKEIQDMLAQKIAAKPKVDEEVEERKLTEALTEIYKQWLNQIKIALSSKTISVDDDMMKNAIKDAIETSRATKKYKIAEDLEKQFESDKEIIVKEQQEKEFKDKVYKIFGAEILKVIETIRAGADLKGTLEDICITADLKDKLSQLSASSDLTNKEEIIAEGKTQYLTHIKDIIRKEKIQERRNLESAIEEQFKRVETFELNEDFETRVRSAYETVETAHNMFFGKVEIKCDFENNKVSVHYPYQLYNGKNYDSKFGHFTRELMPEKMHEAYLAMKNPKKPVVTEETEDEKQKFEQDIITALQAMRDLTNNNTDTLRRILTELENWPKDRVNNVIIALENRGIIQINADGTFTKVEPKPSKTDEELHVDDPEVIPDIKVNNSKRLKFVSTSPQVINRLTNKILTADELQLSLITNGLKIKYSENLRAQLKALNAKLSLVHKETYQRRKTIDISGEEEDKVFANPKKGEEFDPYNYRIEIRTDKMDKNGQKTGRTEAVFKMDIDEELATELKSHKTL